MAGTRTQTTLEECQRLLAAAKSCATAMQGLAEVEGNALRTQEAQQKLQRDLGPLSREVDRQVSELSARQDLFYQPPNSGHSDGRDLESLIQSSDDLLRESQSVLAETEQIGTSTLMQMGRQREQLQNASGNLDRLQTTTAQAKQILVSMSRKALKTKLGLYVTISILVMANLWVLVKIYHKHHSAGGDEHGGDEGGP